jgi:beta-lactamase regulating signal transducer with metallopeptidase domain
LLRPRIVMAESTLALPREQLRAVFLHELAHLRRRDLMVNTVQIVLQALWFFHPGLWITNWLIRRERE